MEFKEKVFEKIASVKYNGMNVDDVIASLCSSLKTDTRTLCDALDSLCTEGRLDIAENDTISITTYTGTYRGNRHGGNFIETLDGKKIKVSTSKNILLLHGDKVRYSTFSNDNETTAVVNSLIGRANNSIIGQVMRVQLSENKSDWELIFVPHDRRYGVSIPLKQNARALSLVGHKCTANLNYSDDGHTFEAVVDKDFGMAGDPIVENEVIAHSHKFKKDFPKAVQIESVLVDRNISDEERASRVDFTHIPFVTIDPEDCKDMDDATYCEKTPTGYTLYLALADVSHYVKPGSMTDREALVRGTSAYLGDGVYPMLPEVYSNDLCSLNPNEDRLALVYTIYLDQAGKLINYSIDKGIINSRYKLSKKQAQNIHEEKEYEHIKKADTKENIDMLYELSDKLKKNRLESFPIDISSHEPTFRFNETRTGVTKVLDTSDETAASVVEECMILGNLVMGDYCKKNNLPILYRVHETPSDMKIEELQMTLDDLGIDYKLSNNSMSLSDLAQKIKGHPLERQITSRILRTFPKAYYRREDVGHFGLGIESGYVHSTAAIRRYPDKLIQDTVSDHLEGVKKTRYSQEMLDTIAADLSYREREADKASRESNALLETMYCNSLVGTTAEATIFDILSDGLVLTIKNEQDLDMINVFMPFKSLRRKFVSNMSHTKCKCEDLEYTLGDKIKVKIKEASIEDRRVLVEPASSSLLKKIATPPSK